MSQTAIRSSERPNWINWIGWSGVAITVASFVAIFLEIRYGFFDEPGMLLIPMSIGVGIWMVAAVIDMTRRGFFQLFR